MGNVEDVFLLIIMFMELVDVFRVRSYVYLCFIERRIYWMVGKNFWCYWLYVFGSSVKGENGEGGIIMMYFYGLMMVLWLCCVFFSVNG